MKKVWISYCTEYEAGWGQRPDGLMIGADVNKEVMLAEIKKRSEGDRDIFWRYSEPITVYCTKKTYKAIKKKEDHNRISHYGNSEKLELFNKI
jgi:hypothetical protein